MSGTNKIDYTFQLLCCIHVRVQHMWPSGGKTSLLHGFKLDNTNLKEVQTIPCHIIFLHLCF